MQVDYGSAVFVRNLDDGLAFYKKLGFELKERGSKPGASWLEIALEDDPTPTDEPKWIALVKFTEAPQFDNRIGGHTGLVFVTNDIDSTFESLKEKGVSFEWKPILRPWGGSDAQFMDQDDNKILLVERAGELSNDEGLTVLRSHRPTE
jgi:catechol 2,3-dioxygenase-like lactoylglutathione lyase family enzyme